MSTIPPTPYTMSIVRSTEIFLNPASTVHTTIYRPVPEFIARVIAKICRMKMEKTDHENFMVSLGEMNLLKMVGINLGRDENYIIIALCIKP